LRLRRGARNAERLSERGINGSEDKQQADNEKRAMRQGEAMAGRHINNSPCT
jgi:hypothetical protein